MNQVLLRADGETYYFVNSNLYVAHNENGDDRLTVPIGLGITKTVLIGKMPAILRAEVHHSVIRPESYGEV